MKIPPHTLQLVIWQDACGPDSCQDQTLSDIAQARPLLMAEVGFVVQESDECITLAPEISDLGIMRRTITIPRVCIKKRFRLDIGKGRRQ